MAYRAKVFPYVGRFKWPANVTTSAWIVDFMAQLRIPSPGVGVRSYDVQLSWPSYDARTIFLSPVSNQTGPGELTEEVFLHGLRGPGRIRIRIRI